MLRRKMMFVAILGLAALSAGQPLWATEQEDQKVLIKSMGAVQVTLQRGLTAAEQQGQPISAKFEVENGKFQLSVYTAKEGKFSEVIVDYATGKVTKVSPITEGDDLTASKSQSAAMEKAKITLKAVVDKAVRGSGGFRPVSVIPDLKDGHAIASVTLLKGNQFKTVQQSLE